MSFVGGKGQAGLFQRIINEIPKHLVFIEPFAGLATISRRKRAAATSIAVDKTRHPRLVLPPWVKFVRGCGVDFLKNYPWTGAEVVYCDPPYLLSTRRYRVYYPHEWAAEFHAYFLEVAIGIPSKVIISGYRSELYDEKLKNWRRVEIVVQTRHHENRTECLWMNFPAPTELHEYTVAGSDKRERLRIKRKIARWVAKFSAEPPIERAALYAALTDVMGANSSRPASGVASLDPVDTFQMEVKYPLSAIPVVAATMEIPQKAIEVVATPAEPKPYGYDVEIRQWGESGNKSFHCRGSEATARRKARLQSRFQEIVSMTPLTEDAWVRCYGRGRM